MLRVLLVEDNELNRDMLLRRLQRRGCEVATAVDGVEAFAKACATRPDIVLMDMSLPIEDGWQATRRLKSSNETRHIPVIGLSAHAMAEDRQKALDAGCDDYDTKPVDLARLWAKIQTLVETPP